MRHLRRRSTIASLALGLACLLVVTGSGAALGDTPVPIGLPGQTTGTGTPSVPGTAHIPDGSIVQLTVTGTKADGTPVAAHAYAAVVDASGLLVAPANVAAPNSVGVAIGWQWPFLGFTVMQIDVAVTSGPNTPFLPRYTASVAAVDGLLDIAVLKIDNVLGPTGPTPVTPGSVNLPVIPISTTEPTVGAPLIFPSYVETTPQPVGSGTYTELNGTLKSFSTNTHIPGKNVWIETDIVPPVAYSSGPILDATGGMVGFGTWLPAVVPSNIFGATSALFQPVIDAAKSGQTYVTPYIVPGTGTEAATMKGFTDATNPCAATPGAGPIASGAKQISAVMSWSGFTDGEDVLSFWFDPVAQQILAYATDQWTSGASGDCLYSQLNGPSGGALADGKYSYNLYAGGDLHFVVGGSTSIAASAPQGVRVTGRVLDADTGKGIAGVLVSVLKPGTDPQTWFNSGTAEQVASSGITDETGTYTTDPAITPGKYPFVLIPTDGHNVAGGELTVSADGHMPDVSLTSAS